MGGSEYIRAADWAEESGLTMIWHKGWETLKLTNAYCSIALETASRSARKAEIDGVPVWLSLPVIQRGGVPMISVADILTTFDPMAAPRKSPGAHRKPSAWTPGTAGATRGKSRGELREEI